MKPVRSVLPIAFALLFSVPTKADEGDAVNFFAGTRVLRDDNIFRLPDGASVQGARADSQYTAFVGGRFDWTYGRQRLLAGFDLDRVRYDRFGFLDHNGSNAQIGWKWALGNRWKGELGLEQRRMLSAFSDIQFAPGQQPEGNLSTVRQARASANYWFHPDWSLLGGVASRRVANSAAFRRGSDFVGESGEVGVLMRRASGNELGLRYRRSNGNYPNRVVIAGSTIDNSYRQHDVEANALWLASGHSRLALRAGLTQRSHDELAQRDFRGVTGRLSYDWLVNGKSALALTLRREVENSDAANASYADVRGISIVPRWRPTAKTSLEGRLEYRSVAYRGDPGIVVANTDQRRDRIESLGLTATHVPWRFLELSLTLQTERRHSNNPQLPYRDNLGYVSAQISF